MSKFSYYCLLLLSFLSFDALFLSFSPCFLGSGRGLGADFVWCACRRGHYQRPLEEAVHAHVTQWPRSWDGKSPFAGGRHFSALDAPQRVSLVDSRFFTHSPRNRLTNEGELVVVGFEGIDKLGLNLFGNHSRARRGIVQIKPS